MSDSDLGNSLAEQVINAYRERSTLCINGNGSKSREGRKVEATSINVSDHRGIIDYTPTELVITARAGTLLTNIEAELASAKQMLPFEPPHLGEGATLGGTIACGLSGPRRPYAGAARDMVLGMRVINGRGEVLRFGGQVMKNVAGYDVSRLMVGAQGTLGVLLDISIKVSPMPECERTLCLPMTDKQAIEVMNQWAGKPVPLSAACFVPDTDSQSGQGKLWLRLSGVETAVKSATNLVGGELIELGKQFWLDLKERRLDFFRLAELQQEGALWRLSLPPAVPPPALAGATLIDWGGAQRWLISGEPPDKIHQTVTAIGGYATRYSSSGAQLPPLNPTLRKLHQRVKEAFDPEGVLNPGRLYEGL
ncbi:glycolate oxidase subunit GlcE [Kaarinaea lacus]